MDMPAPGRMPQQMDASAPAGASPPLAASAEDIAAIATAPNGVEGTEEKKEQEDSGSAVQSVVIELGERAVTIDNIHEPPSLYALARQWVGVLPAACTENDAVAQNDNGTPIELPKLLPREQFVETAEPDLTVDPAFVSRVSSDLVDAVLLGKKSLPSKTPSLDELRKELKKRALFVRQRYKSHRAKKMQRYRIRLHQILEMAHKQSIQNNQDDKMNLNREPNA